MDGHNIIDVALGDRAYEIRVGDGLLGHAGKTLAPLLGHQGAKRHVIVVTDRNVVAGHHLDTLTRSLDAAGIGHDAIVLDPGEHTKDFAHLEKLLGDILDIGIERNSMLVALGGGVVGDITGFAAAVALRGIDFVQMPTTLLAQVDSSVGGKTAINTRHGKNLVGAFYQPRLVLADIATLDTLPLRELQAGYAEVVKYGIIRDAGFFDWLEEGHGKALIEGDRGDRIEAVAVSCQAKADVVAADEREHGERALLNLGHTFGHAMEAETGYLDRLLHGEAVAIGMVLALALSEDLGLCPPGRADRLRAHLEAVGMRATPDGLGFDAARLVAHMHHDKKVTGGKLTFILARDIGAGLVVHDVDENRVQDLLAARLTS